jgi:hypothetical protein
VKPPDPRRGVLTSTPPSGVGGFTYHLSLITYNMCNRANLKTIKGLCGEGSAPEMKNWVFVTTMEDILTIPTMASESFGLSLDISMRPPSASGVTPVVEKGKWERWDVAKTDSGYSANRKDNHYEPKFEYFIERLDEVKTYILAKARGEKLAVIGTDNNGKPRLMTNAEIMFDEQTKGKNGYKVEFVCGPVPDPLPFYMGTVVQ